MSMDFAGIDKLQEMESDSKVTAARDAMPTCHEKAQAVIP